MSLGGDPLGRLNVFANCSSLYCLFSGHSLLSLSGDERTWFAQVRNLFSHSLI